jgi:hypothetical protein
MNGISRLVAYEIAGNPDDIVIAYGGPDKETGKFAGWITRGEGHNFKPLLNTEPIYDTPKQAKETMEKVVQEIKDFVEKDLKDPKIH